MTSLAMGGDGGFREQRTGNLENHSCREQRIGEEQWGNDP